MHSLTCFFNCVLIKHLLFSFNSDNDCSKAKEYWIKTIKNWEERQIFSPKQVKMFTFNSVNKSPPEILNQKASHSRPASAYMPWPM